jgi:hypothetical protein
MSSAQSEATTDEASAEGSSVWVRPEYARLKVSEAEGVDGTGTDSGGLLS